MPTIPTKTTSPPTPVLKRQATVTVTHTLYPNGPGGPGLSGGAIAGIVIGSVVAFLLLLWLVYVCTSFGYRRRRWSSSDTESGSSPSPHRHGHHHHHHHHHDRRGRRYYRPRLVREVTESRTVRPAVVVESSSLRSASPRRPPSARYQSRGRSSTTQG